MGLKRKPYFKMQEFYCRVNKKLLKKYGWQGIYSELEIIYIDNLEMQNALSQIMDDLKIEFNKRKYSLNNNVYKTINTHAERKYNDYLQANEQVFLNILNFDNWYGDGDEHSKEMNKLKNQLFPYPNDYVDNQKELADLFIQLD
jgi:hypothetical protein